MFVRLQVSLAFAYPHHQLPVLVLANALMGIATIRPLVLGTSALAMSVWLQVSLAFAYPHHQLPVLVLANALMGIATIRPLVPGTSALAMSVWLQVSLAFAYPHHQLLVLVLTNALMAILRILPLVLGAAAYHVFWIEFFALVLADALMLIHRVRVGFLAATGAALIVSGLDVMKVGFGVGKCSDGAQGKKCAQEKVFEKHGDRRMV
ncbi:hypothetical protein BFJ69_g8203 [Fusarium oxysporum]|uniref:Uncharacterized protein n=1 Tax=Fusarium oxysporum TaxID=5507 RepID=A0A420N382_FUSOX|nr:hypothetical protein BFJ69_g8203 [Fusarium oxysporum]